MSVGIIMMTHGRLERPTELARSLVMQGCRLAIHVDAKTPDRAVERMQAALADLPEILWMPRRRCDWGKFSLVEVSQEAAELMLATFRDVGHICLISGSCLPVRPVRELQAFLHAHADTDFIESVDIEAEDWVVDGLSRERFTLHFPFDWRRQRWLFDRAVALQRRLGVHRRIPAGLRPHIGSQWWCLTRRTLRRILDDPDRAVQERYFRTTWIPDESYFATLVRKHSTRIASRSLTFGKFDPQGRPHVFYDDHAAYLERTDCFFARKIWRGADELYARYLDPDRIAYRGLGLEAPTVENIFAAAHDRRCNGRAGLVMQSRFSCGKHEMQKSTARDFSVFDGFDFLFRDFPEWLGEHCATQGHGRLFEKRTVPFAGHQPMLEGCLPATPAIRDWNPEQFLTSLLWNRRSEHQSFLFTVSDSTRMASFLLKDPNATIYTITGAWVLALEQPIGEEDQAFIRRARKLAALEAKHLGEMELPTRRATLKRWTLGEVLAAPFAVLATLRDDHIRQPRTAGGAIEMPAEGAEPANGAVRARPMAMPELGDLARLPEMLARLERLGIGTASVGTLPDRIGQALPADEDRKALFQA
ncbi:MAG: beta-1,6-N-acetylglucosaminyltransferase [Pseudomonadota bacterium]